MIDYSLPSTAKRMWVFDLASHRLLFHELVAHGRNTGEEGSLMTSLGGFVTGPTYTGRNGYSLRLRGMESGLNHRAEARAIVVHGAPYVGEDVARKLGRLGRSHGCPALRPTIAPYADRRDQGRHGPVRLAPHGRRVEQPVGLPLHAPDVAALPAPPARGRFVASRSFAKLGRLRVPRRPGGEGLVEGLMVLVVVAFLVLPVLATILGVIALRSIGDLRRRTDELATELERLRSELGRLGARVGSLAASTASPAERADARPAAKSAASTLPQRPPPLAAAPSPARPIPPSAAGERATPPVPFLVTAENLGIAAQTPLPGQPPQAPPPSATAGGDGLEWQLGTRVAVWVGALALALAGAFLVKYSFDRGLLGPAARVTLGLVFGASLLAAGEWIRPRVAGIAQGLAAAGIAVLFAALLAGVNLYHLIPPSVGFALMAVTTATAVLLSLRHGPFVALLGLLGGFLTPVWIGSEHPNPWGLFLYLLLLQAGLLVVTRRRPWWPIAALSVACGLGWAALVVANLERFGGRTLPIGLFLLIALATTWLLTRSGTRWEDARVPLGLVGGGAALGLAVLAALVGAGRFGLKEWVFFGLLGTGCFVLSWLDERYEPLAWIATFLGAATLFVWGTKLLPGEHARYWGIGATAAALCGGGAYAVMWSSRAPQRWAVLSSVAALVWFFAVYTGLERVPFPAPWGVQSLVVAVAFTALASSVAKRRATLARGDESLAALAVAVTTFVSLAVPLELERAWITVAWAVELPALAWIASRLRVPYLDRLAWLLAAAVAARLLLNPEVLRYPTGTGVPFNWLLYGYGVPVAAFALAGRIFSRMGERQLAQALGAGAVALGWALITLQVRQYFHPGQLGAPGVALAEWGTYTIGWLVYALGLHLAYERTKLPLFRYAAPIVGTAAFFQGLLTQGLAANPLVEPHPVGSMIVLNRLLFVYGLPAALGALVAWRLRAVVPRALTLAGGGVALAWLFEMISLMVRQAFQGDVLRGGTTTNAEMYTYSLVWIVLATLLLVAGIATRGTVVRYGSAVVMALAVGKVFLVDTANLEDLYRVLSFLGLGLSLMLLAFLYQRFVFGERRL